LREGGSFWGLRADRKVGTELGLGDMCRTYKGILDDTQRFLKRTAPRSPLVLFFVGGKGKIGSELYNKVGEETMAEV